MWKSLNLAVVGHTNVGKTSLLRALIHDSRFGLVSNRAGTTRHVESITIRLGKEKTIVFYDTPGLEDSVGLHNYIYKLTEKSTNIYDVDRLNVFLKSPEADTTFNQEAKVIKQLLKSDAALYVIDVREPVLPKYHEELSVLTYGDKPILAILNFTAKASGYENDWRRLLSRVGIHAVIRFDAVFPPIDGEERLYKSLSLLIEPAKEILDRWMEQLLLIRKSRDRAANRVIAETLFDVTAYHELAKVDDVQAIRNMQDKIREREQKAIDELLELFRFNPAQESEEFLPLAKGRYDTDLFNNAALKLMGIQVSKGLMSGAAIGLGIDLAAGGITLGSATLIGAFVGGFSQAVKHYGDKINDHFSGFSKLSVDDAVICFLCLRLIYLKMSLSERSHANPEPITLSPLDKKEWENGILPKSLSAARGAAFWSSLSGEQARLDQKREKAIQKIIDELFS